MATNQNEEFEQLLYAWWRTTHQTFIKMFCQNTCSEIAIKSYFHFSHYKSMENFKLPQQRKHMINGNKNTNFVEANVMNISAKFQLSSPLWLLRNWFFNIFSKIHISVAMATNQIQRFGQKSYVW